MSKWSDTPPAWVEEVRASQLAERLRLRMAEAKPWFLLLYEDASQPANGTVVRLEYPDDDSEDGGRDV